MSSTELGTALQVRPYVAEDEPAVLALLVGALGEGPSGHGPRTSSGGSISRTPSASRCSSWRSSMARSWACAPSCGGDSPSAIGRSGRCGRSTRPPARTNEGRGSSRPSRRPPLAELRTDTDLVFNTPNGSSRPGYLKMGWQEVGRVPVWIKVRRPVAFARGLRSATSVTTRPTREIDVDAPLAAAGFGDDDDLRPFLEQLDRPADRLATPYTPEYLTWRYASAPLGYRAIVTRDAGRIQGIAIFRVRPEASSGRPRSRRSSCGRGTRLRPRTSSIAWQRLRPSITSRAISRPGPRSSPPRGGDGSSALRKGTSS